MRLGGRLAAAVEVLDDIQRRHRPVSDALKDWGLSHRFAGAGDRAAIGNIVYDALRKKRSAAWLLQADTPRALALGSMLLDGLITAPALNEQFDGDRFAPAPLDQQELRAVSLRDERPISDVEAADCPDWCAPLLEKAFGDSWVAEAQALSERPPLDLRVNTLKADMATVLGELKETGARAMQLAANGIRIPPISGAGRHPNVQVEPAFQQGWFEVQDEGSQVVSQLAGAEPGMQVLDYCAGAGGKTLALAADMKNEGRIVAFDSEKQRLAPIFDRVQRANAQNVKVVSRVGDLDAEQSAFDLVLVDAPCTGSGTWRRRPDAKWRLTARQLDVRKSQQSAILDKAAAFTKPGGTLAYITCSVFDQENSDQIDAFLKRQPGWTMVDPATLWAQRVGKGADLPLIDPRKGVRLTPRRTATDGFYFAAVKRN